MQLASYVLALSERSAVFSNWRYIGIAISIEWLLQNVLYNSAD